jgi:hypothetical protein
VDLFNILATEMNDHAVEEFAKYMIGRPNEWGRSSKRSAQYALATIPPRRAKAEPKYVCKTAGPGA